MRVVPCAGSPTPRLLRACAIFGLGVETAPRARAAAPHETTLAAAHAARLDHLLRPGERALVTGPSGAGKTTLLRALAAHLRRRGQRPIVLREHEPALDDRFVADALGASLDGTLDALARAGLADAILLTRRVCDLSRGERYRLALARAILAAERAAYHRTRRAHAECVTLIADEFASLLDRTTARSICLGLARRGHPRVRLVVATAHEDVREWLSAHVIAAGEQGPERAGSGA